MKQLINKSRETISNRGNEYYQNNKERLKEQTRNKYWKLSDEKIYKYIKREYRRNKHHNISKGNKNRRKEYEKKKKHNKFFTFLLHGIKMKKNSWFLVKNTLLKMNFKYMGNQSILIK